MSVHWLSMRIQVGTNGMITLHYHMLTPTLLQIDHDDKGNKGWILTEEEKHAKLFSVEYNILEVNLIDITYLVSTDRHICHSCDI